MNHTPVHVEDYMVPLGGGHYHVIGTSTNEIAYCARHDDAVQLARACNVHEELVAALKGLAKEINLSKLNVRKDFSLMNAHAYATKIIAKAEGKE